MFWVKLNKKGEGGREGRKALSKCWKIWRNSSAGKNNKGRYQETKY